MTAVGFLRRNALPLGILLATLALWELVVVIRDIPAFVLPSPSRILARLVEMRAILLPHIRVTVTEALLGYMLGLATGVGLAIFMSFAPVLRKAVYPLVLATQTTPKIAVAPLFVIWFGVGLLPKVLIVALLAFFPIFINTLAGLDSTDRDQLNLLYSVDASRWRVYWSLRVPSAIPYLFAGMKLALTVSIIGAIIGEWIASERGLGYLLIFYNFTLRTSDLFVVLLVLVALATAAFAAILILERLLSWEARIMETESGVVQASDRDKIAQEVSL